MAAGQIIHYTGNGQSGVWNDPANWSGGAVPGAADTAIFQSSAPLNGPIEVFNLMLLGQETNPITGAIRTDNTNVCQSFMVCEGAVANFTPGSSLHSAGGVVVGIDGVGTVNVAAAANNKAAANVTATVVKIGQHDGGNGTINVAGTLTATTQAYIGIDGHGVMNVTGSGQVTLGDLKLGDQAGGTGTLTLSNAADVTVNGWLTDGTSVAGAPGGTGTIVLGGTSVLNLANTSFVNAGSAIAVAGGTLNQGSDGPGLQINTGGTVSGFGTINSTVHGVLDNGTLASAGGTLVVNGNVAGMGVVQIGAGSTLDLNASKINVASIAFLGSGDTLGLTAGVGGLTLTGFGAGDQIDMNGIDGLSWNGAADALTLTEHGHFVEKLTLSGVAASATFHITAGAGGSVISLVAPQGSQGFVTGVHH